MATGRAPIHVTYSMFILYEVIVRWTLLLMYSWCDPIEWSDEGEWSVGGVMTHPLSEYEDKLREIQSFATFLKQLKELGISNIIEYLL